MISLNLLVARPIYAPFFILNDKDSHGEKGLKQSTLYIQVISSCLFQTIMFCQPSTSNKACLHWKRKLIFVKHEARTIFMPVLCQSKGTLRRLNHQQPLVSCCLTSISNKRSNLRMRSCHTPALFYHVGSRQGRTEPNSIKQLFYKWNNLLYI